MPENCGFLKANFSFSEKTAWGDGEKLGFSEEYTPDEARTSLKRTRSKKRVYVKSSDMRAKARRYQPASGEYKDIAVLPTIKAAAMHPGKNSDLSCDILMSDIQKKIRYKKRTNLILFVVDASSSMAMAGKMAAAKGAILLLLSDAYQNRNRVSLIVFKQDHAETILEPTTSVNHAREVFENITMRGYTPLSSGLLKAAKVIKKENLCRPDEIPVVVLMTDGEGNVSALGMDAGEEAVLAGKKIRQEGADIILINTAHPKLDSGSAKILADNIGAVYHTLTDMTADSLYMTICDDLEMINKKKTF